MMLRFIRGMSILIGSLILAILMSFAKDKVVQLFGHEDRFDFLFGIIGLIMCCASIGLAFVIITDNIGEGFNNDKK